MIGEVLRAEREKQNLTIKDIEKGTSIRALYIDAIEKGNYEQLPGEVYTKGFIRNYAHFLKLDSNEIMQQYMAEQHPDKVQAQPQPQPQPEAKKEEVKPEPVKAEPKQEKEEKKPAAEVKQSAPQPAKKAPTRTERRTHEVHKPYTNSTKHSDHTSSRKKIFAILAVIIVVIAAAAYAMSGSSDKAQQQPAQQAQTQQQAAPAPEQQQVSGVQVVATFSEDCWTQVTIDGKEVYEGTETKGKTETWQGTQNVVIRVGNAGAVDVKLNGQDLGKVGGEGQVVTKTYTQDGEQAAPAAQQQSQQPKQQAQQQQAPKQQQAQPQQQQQKGNKN